MRCCGEMCRFYWGICHDVSWTCWNSLPARGGRRYRWRRRGIVLLGWIMRGTCWRSRGAKRDGVGISERDLSFVHGDVLRLKLRRKFDWIILLFNTFLAFQTLEDQDALLQGVLRHLKPRGRFWLDIFQPNLELIAQAKSKNLDPVLFHVPELSRTVFRSTSVERDPATQIQKVTFHYRWIDERGREHRQRVVFALTFVFPRELRLLLERNGLLIEKNYGDYDGSELNADSPRMIAVCRRR